MTVTAKTTAGTSSVPLTGQSQWALVWREFRKRRLAVLAAVVIVMLVTASVFAPFLANAAPIFYRGYNRFEYQEAARTLRATITQTIEAKANEAKKRTELARSRKGALVQLDLMSRALPTEKATALKAFEKQLIAAIDSADASAEQLKGLQKELRSSFDAKEVTLVPRTHWPVIASLNGLEVGFLLANALFFLIPVWSWLLRRLIGAHHDRRLWWSSLGVQVGLPLIAGCLWWWFVPVRIDRTDYKKGVLAADEAAAAAPVVYETVVWPLIVYSIDEYDLAGKSAAPFWYPKSWCPPGKDAASMKSTSAWSGPHWLGTDEAGRDVCSRMIWGGRVSLSVGLVAVAIYVSIGIVVGAVAGYFRGICDLIISRIIEVIICFPTFFLILTIVAFFGQSITHIMIIIGLTGWTGIARLVRGEFLRLVDQEFVLAGRALGYTPSRIIFRHVLPNAMAPVLVSATFGIAGAILTESALSFLGLGISKPTPSWGGLLADGREALQHAPWLIHFPGFAIFVTITAYNLMGEALRDASDPRLRGSR